MSGRAYISYRKGLHLQEAQLLHSALEKRLPSGVARFDANESNPTTSWLGELRRADPNRTVIFVLASEAWVDMRDASGTRLLAQEGDPLRQELLAGIENGAIMIPVVLDGAYPISIARLPEELWPVFLRPAERFRPEAQDEDASRLAALVKEALKPAPRRMSIAGAALFGAGALAAGAALGVGFQNGWFSDEAIPPVISAAITPEGNGGELYTDADLDEAAAAARAEVEERLATLEAELATAREALEQARAEAEAERAALEQQLADAREAVEQARTDASARQETLEIQLEALREEAKASERELREAVMAREVAVARAAQEKEARMAAEDAVARLEDTIAVQEAAAEEAAAKTAVAEAAAAAAQAAAEEAEKAREAEAAAAAEAAVEAEALARAAEAAAEAETAAEAANNGDGGSRRCGKFRGRRPGC